VARQLTLDLPARAAMGRGDFFVSPGNASAVSAVPDRGFRVETGEPEGVR